MDYNPGQYVLVKYGARGGRQIGIVSGIRKVSGAGVPYYPIFMWSKNSARWTKTARRTAVGLIIGPASAADMKKFRVDAA